MACLAYTTCILALVILRINLILICFNLVNSLFNLMSFACNSRRRRCSFLCLMKLYQFFLHLSKFSFIFLFSASHELFSFYSLGQLFEISIKDIRYEHKVVHGNEYKNVKRKLENDSKEMHNFLSFQLDSFIIILKKFLSFVLISRLNVI